jgi:tRNA nucleotidyltransferase (CCA-adding enzyme)
MSRPARSVSLNETVSRAMVACQRHAQSGILVIEDGQLVGAVSREDLDKAIAHGLSHAPVKGIMSSRVATVAAAAPLAEVQEALAESPDGRVAVLEDGAVVGVVTRSDLLRALGERPEVEVEPGASLAGELSALTELAPVFEAVAAASEPYDGVYLVGGTVRDILLGEPNFDVDIAVEGDAIGLARSVADALGGRVRAHSKFGTAVVVYGDAQRIDVVTARTEFYDAPAALPSVEHATIREDLFRRDFTINAMAVSLKGEDFGRLVDPFHGRRDLEAKTIRVLHNLSFIDDPTRIFRAIRYESRYGFGLDEHSQRLARGTIEMGLVGDLSSARLRDELIALLEEGDAGASILRLAERRDAERIAWAVTVGPRLVERLHGDTPEPAEIVALAEPYAPDAPLFALALADPEPLQEYFERLRDVRLEVSGADLAKLGVGESPQVGEILAELRRRKLNGQLDGRESELAAARELIG